MHNEEYEHDAMNEVEEFEELDIDSILNQYRKKRMFDMLVGPVISLSFHVSVVVCLAIFAIGTTVVEKPETVLTIIEQEIIELDPEDPDIPEVDLEEVPLEDVVIDVVVPVVVIETSIADFDNEQPETQDDSDMSEVLDTEITNCVLKSPATGGRSPHGRKRAIGIYGGESGEKNQVFVKRTLKWLQYHQNYDGSWPEGGKGYKHAMTGLSLLCFLAHGETPMSEKYGETVRKGIDWLLDNTSADNITDRGYSYAIAVYALSEAYGMTKAPKINAALTYLIKPIIEGQDEQHGWAYGFKHGDAKATDISLSGWCLQALKAAYASGVDVDGLTESLENGAKLCDNAISYKTGLGKYRMSESKGSKMSMGAAAGLCMQLLGENQSAKVGAVYNHIIKSFKDDKKGEFSWTGKGALNAKSKHHFIGYNWYYQTQVVFQRMNKSNWKKWNEKFLTKQIAANQQEEIAKEDRNGVKAGTKLGYWPWPSGGGASSTQWERYYSTTLCCLQLQVYYRLLPGSKRPNDKSASSDLEALNTNLIFEEESDELNF